MSRGERRLFAAELASTRHAREDRDDRRPSRRASLRFGSVRVSPSDRLPPSYPRDDARNIEADQLRVLRVELGSFSQRFILMRRTLPLPGAALAHAATVRRSPPPRTTSPAHFRIAFRKLRRIEPNAQRSPPRFERLIASLDHRHQGAAPR
jgi:hypothetical protein